MLHDSEEAESQTSISRFLLMDEETVSPGARIGQGHEKKRA